MLEFSYKAIVRERVKAKCSRHPRYNPEKEGRNGIKGACSGCHDILKLQEARQALDAAIREFVRRAGPWARPRGTRQRRKPVQEPENGQQMPEVLS